MKSRMEKAHVAYLQGDEMKVICNNSESEEERGKQFATTAVYMSFSTQYVFFV